MPIDIRANAAQYYDLNPQVPNDLPFYRKRIPSPEAAVLELGCGTGRVLVPLAEHCGFVHGVDASEAMIAICREKLARAGLDGRKAQVEVGDITALDLGRQFDLITAPFRVFQNLETDAEIDGLFATVQRHLAPTGACILNAFNPKRDRETLRRTWANEAEFLAWEAPIEGGRVTCHGRNARMDAERMVLYPELNYRRHRGAELADEATLKIVMRCWYPDEFQRVILDHGFKVMAQWGGYAGEAYGQGPELVIQFGRGPEPRTPGERPAASIALRPATPADLPEMNAIFNYYVAHSTCVWTTTPCSEAERRAWYGEHTETMPVVVAECDGRVVGWGSLSSFRTAYTQAGTLEDSIYVHHDFHRRGIGSRLLAELIATARRIGLRSILANISADQEPSIRLHEKFGFVHVAHLRQVGRKFDRRLDAVYLQLMLTGDIMRENEEIPG